ncbi:MAG: hypothetical protein EAY75_14510 [Bacteroidetes bacterium]|nr:MAG: hypothetical protein EAY75_14510 [Bacteroidota bacterium]
MLKILQSFCCLGLSLGLFAQEKPVYPFLKNDSILQKKLIGSAAQKHQSIIAGYEKNKIKLYKEIYSTRHQNVMALLESKKPVTDSTVFNYLQAIVAKIVAANAPVMAAQDLRVLFSKDAAPNAYSMGDGTLVVNAGLVAFLQNEAELAFVLCHEMAHHYLAHSDKQIRKYVETTTDEDFQAKLRQIKRTGYGGAELDELSQNLLLDSRKHSRNNEMEADQQAMQYMRNTGYDCRAILSCLKLLDQIDDSLLYKPIDIAALLNSDEYPFRSKWLKTESAIFSEMSKAEMPAAQSKKDSLKTHPDCDRRMALLKESVEKMPPGKLFLVNEALFKNLKTNFFVEFTAQEYNDAELTQHLYHAMQLAQWSNDFRDLGIFLMARCFNALYQNQQAHTLGTKIQHESPYTPENYKLLLRFIDRIKLNELASVNYFFCKQHEKTLVKYQGGTDIVKTAIAQYKNHQN